MSAISSLPDKAATTGLVDAVDKFDRARRALYLQRAAQRMIMDEVDEHLERGTEEQRAIRKRVMDTIAWYRNEIEKWVTQEYGEIPNSPANDLEPSDSALPIPKSS